LTTKPKPGRTNLDFDERDGETVIEFTCPSRKATQPEDDISKNNRGRSEKI